jgi:hypothetical protein
MRPFLIKSFRAEVSPIGLGRAWTHRIIVGDRGGCMSHFAPWYRRDEYALMREILHDGETLPLSFDKWEKEAESERANAIPVLLDPDGFFTCCKEKKISPNRATAAAFASSRGAADPQADVRGPLAAHSRFHDPQLVVASVSQWVQVGS